MPCLDVGETVCQLRGPPALQSANQSVNQFPLGLPARPEARGLRAGERVGGGLRGDALPRAARRSRDRQDAARVPLASRRRPSCRDVRRAALQGRRNALPQARDRDDRLRGRQGDAHARRFPYSAPRQRRHGEALDDWRRGAAPPRIQDGAFKRSGRGVAGEDRMGLRREPVRRDARREHESERAVRQAQPLDAHALLAPARGLYARAGREVRDVLHGRSRGTRRALGLPRAVRHGTLRVVRVRAVACRRTQRGAASRHSLRARGERRGGPGAARVPSGH